jgi:type II secretion system protein H
MHAERRPRFHRGAGYTLIELAAVVIIIGLVLSMAVMRADSIVPRFELEREASDIALTLRDARNRAVIDDRAVRLEINPQTREMSYFYDEPGPQDDPLTFLGDEPFATKTWGERVVLQRAWIGRDEVKEQDIVLKFWPDGLCTPVRLQLQHARGPDLKCTVQLNPLTGLTKVLKGFVDPEFYEVKTAAPAARQR